MTTTEADDMADLSNLPPALLERFQARLEAQLILAREQLDAEVKEQEAKRQEVMKSKEELGLRLYNTQQSLAKLQMAANRAEEALAQQSKRRAEAEQMAGGVKELEKQARDEAMKVGADLAAQMMELNKLNEQVRQIEESSRGLAGKAGAQEQAAGKAALEVKEVGKKKMEQDFLVDKLNEELKALQDRIGSTTQQFQSQKLENAAIAGLLAEANAELDALAMQKRRREQEWKDSVLAFGKLNSALAEVDQKVREKVASLATVEAEIAGFRARERLLQEENERVSRTLEKSKNEELYLDRRTEENAKMKEQEALELAKAQKNLDALEGSTVPLNKTIAGIKAQIASLTKEADRVVTQNVELEERISQIMQTQKTHANSAAHSENTWVKLRDEAKERVMQRAKLDNDLAQTKVELLNSTARIAELDATLQESLRELKGREELLGKYEVEIRRHNDESQRKQYEVDRLNRKLESLLSKTQDENTGPLEATIHNLTNEITERQKECVELEGFWLKAQAELVTLQRATHDKQDRLRELASNHAVLSQKQMRLKDAMALQERESKELERSIAAVQRDVERLNAMVSKSSEKRSTLMSGNMAIEAEARDQLEQLQAELRRLEGLLEQGLLEKDSTATQLVEAEESILLWEKKLKLWQETQEAIDPNAGAAETVALQRDIRNLDVALEKMSRQKENLMCEMEKHVDLRAPLMVRVAPTKKKTPTQSETDRFQARRMLSDMAKNLKQLRDDNDQIDMAVVSMQGETEQLKSHTSRAIELGQSLTQNAAVMRDQTDSSISQRQKMANTVTRFQALARRYAEIGAASDKLDARKGQMEKEWLRVTDRATRVKDLFESLQQRYPEFQAKIQSLISPSLPILNKYLITTTTPPPPPQQPSNTTNNQ